MLGQSADSPEVEEMGEARKGEEGSAAAVLVVVAGRPQKQILSLFPKQPTNLGD